MKIGMVTGAPYPPDIRIDKEADALVENGHRVIVFALQNSVRSIHNGKVEAESVPVIGPWIDLSAFRLANALRRHGIEIVHAQDTPGALSATIVARILHVPLVFDVHDFWDELMLEIEGLHTFNRHVSSSWYAFVEKTACVRSDVVLTIVDEAAAYLASKHNLPRAKVLAIMNLEDPDRLPAVPSQRPPHFEGSFIAAYVGGLDLPCRNLSVIPEVARLLRDTATRFLVVGDGPMRARLQDLCRDLGVDDLVHFSGRVPFTTAISYIRGSDVCLLPYNRTLITDNGLSHKLSQYLACGKPVISSRLAPVSRMFGSAVLWWEPRTPERMAELLLSLQADARRCSELGSAGRRLVREKYNWTFEAKKLVNVYDSLSAR